MRIIPLNRLEEMAQYLSDATGESHKIRQLNGLFHLLVNDGDQDRFVVNNLTSMELYDYMNAFLAGIKLTQSRIREALKRREKMYDEQIAVEKDEDRLRALNAHKREAHEILVNLVL